MRRFLAMLALFPVLAYACDCPPNPVCGGINPQGRFFTGVAVSRRAVESHSRQVANMVAYRIRVRESFSPGIAAGSTIEVRTGTSPDCAASFFLNQPYLFEAYQDGTSLDTSACTWDQPLGQAGPILQQLRALQRHQALPSLAGALVRGDGGMSNQFAGVRVTARSAAGATFSTQSNAEGEFAFERLPAGTYTITPTWPRGDRADGGPATVAVPSESGVEGSCRILLHARP